MTQLDMFADNTDLEKPLGTSATARVLHTVYLNKVVKLWQALSRGDAYDARSIHWELEGIARNLHSLNRYNVYCVEFKRITSDFQGKQVKQPQQVIVYAENEREAEEFLAMDLAIRQCKSRYPVRHSKLKFVTLPDHLRKDTSDND